MRLPAPVTSSGEAALRRLIEAPRKALVGLDFDGTLAPIVEDPALARPVDGALGAVRELAARVGSMAVVSGRPAAAAATLLGLSPGDPDNVLVLGHYGLQRWTPRGGVDQADFDPEAIEAVKRRLPGLLRELNAPPGVTLEDKAESVAVHTRRATAPADALEMLRGPLAALADSHGLRLEPGRLVLELRPAGVDKGLAVEALATERGATTVCYAGDDLGDLAAYDALDRMRDVGIAALKICSGLDDVPQLRERADLVFAGPTELVRFLADLAAAMTSGR